MQIILKSGKFLLITVLVILIVPAIIQKIIAQGTNYEYKKMKIGDNLYLFSGLSFGPDHNTLALSCTQNHPLYIFDYEKNTVQKTFDNPGNWYAGSQIDYSENGKYLLLQQLFYMDWAPNKDREVNFDIMDASSGQVVKAFENYHSVTITPDEKYAVTLSGDDEVAFWNLATGLKEKSFVVKDATNCAQISPDGRLIYVSHKPDEDQLKNNKNITFEKKEIKNILKYKQQISVYDAETFSYKYTINELYDIVYRLSFSKDSTKLYCLNIPHTNAQTSTGRQNFVNVIDITTSQPMRRAFPSRAPYEPDFKESLDNKLFGVISQGKFPELHIYDFESGKLLYRYEVSFRLLEGVGDKEFPSDSRISFEFLPDNQSVLMTYGNQLLIWKYKQ